VATGHATSAVRIRADIVATGKPWTHPTKKFGYTENLSDFDGTDRLKSLTKFIGD